MMGDWHKGQMRNYIWYKKKCMQSMHLLKMFFTHLLALVYLFNLVSSGIVTNVNKNISEEAVALAEIICALKPSCLAILAKENQHSNLVNDFIYLIHKLHLTTCIFFNKTNYYQFIAKNIEASIESSSLIFGKPYNIIEEMHQKKLAHRLSLFIFYWGAKHPPEIQTIRFEEPLRGVIITRPRSKAFRIYYNQAVPVGTSNLRLVNWYDAESLGLYKTPLLPSASTIYSNFGGRVFRVPAIHSPPWFFVNNSCGGSYNNNRNCSDSEVLGGRDHQLLILLARKMNFRFEYVEPPEQTQGSSNGDDNLNFTGTIGMIQNKEADILLGDVNLSWERRKAVEFSFFILADSAAFITHAPRKLNEALALLRPFQLNVWPFLIITIVISGPILYLIISIPYKWKKDSRDIIYLEYINEITMSKKPIKKKSGSDKNQIPKDLFQKCVWYVIQLFLKQACSQPHHGYRARFLIVLYWIAATYVLADVYSAQLTSQFARPAREPPIDDLFTLEDAMKNRNYKLFVEKDSSSVEMLENSTEIVRRLYRLMKEQDPQREESGYLIDSIEQGIEMVLDGSETVIFGGRETLFFNIKRRGLKNFQMSYKLFTRYSAVAVQIGCPFLDSLNDVLMRLFEGGILDKMTNSEYEKMSKLSSEKGHKETVKHYKINDNQSTQTSDEKIQPLNLRMLQGAFIFLFIGYVAAGIALVLETIFKHKRPVYREEN